jgi:hypothetical protein
LPSRLVHRPSSLSSRLHRHCSCFALVCCPCGSWLVLARCCQLEQRSHGLFYATACFATVLCPPFLPSRLHRLCSCITFVLCPCGKWLALALCCQLESFSHVALPSLLMQRPCALPSLQMAPACALPSDCVLRSCSKRAAPATMPTSGLKVLWAYRYAHSWRKWYQEKWGS